MGLQNLPSSEGRISWMWQLPVGLCRHCGWLNGYGSRPLFPSQARKLRRIDVVREWGRASSRKNETCL
jgi:hypothetical protein